MIADYVPLAPTAKRRDSQVLGVRVNALPASTAGLSASQRILTVLIVLQATLETSVICRSEGRQMNLTQGL